jgi:hypothetical protein
MIAHMHYAAFWRAASWPLAFGWIFLAAPVEAQEIDSTPPTVAFTQPATGATVAAGVVLRADASDARGVVRVRFFVDDVEIPGSATVAPYWVSWDTADVAEQDHLLTARAEDAAGNFGYATILVTVDRTPPSLELTSPASLATVSNLVTLSASALDNIGVDRVWFSANGVPLGEDSTPPFGIVWDTSLLDDGSYTLQVGARDHAGSLNNIGTVVTVSNGTTRIQENDPAIIYSGTWAHNNAGVRAWNGGTASFNTLTQYAAQATLNFEGTGLTWIGFRGPQAGIARVYLDGVQIATVDLYYPVELVRTPVFNVSGLSSGPHTLMVEATGQWNPSSTDPFVVVDTFIVSQQ